MLQDEFTFEIIKHIGVISERGAYGWKREVNLVSWNGGRTVVDIRDWDPNHEHMGRGITLTAKETIQLVLSLKNFCEDTITNPSEGEHGQ